MFFCLKAEILLCLVLIGQCVCRGEDRVIFLKGLTLQNAQLSRTPEEGVDIEFSGGNALGDLLTEV